MRLSSLTLEQFRSYDRLDVDFSSGGVHVFLGPNGAGKTNILEAISVLSLLKSPRGADEQDMLQWGSDFYRVRATLHTDEGEERTFEVTSQIAPRKQKGGFINDVRTKTAVMVGQLPTVLFLPQDLDLFTGSPSPRRSFLDTLLSQVSPEYSATFHMYQKVLKQRNTVLKKMAETGRGHSDLQTWSEQLAAAGAFLTLKRLELIETLQCTLSEELSALGEEWKDVALLYERKGEQREEMAMKEELLELYAHYEQRDLLLQSTTVGPHREDWRLEVSGRDIATFASRGQQRTALLALLFLEVSYLELKRGERPVVLLDDVFSELDEDHRHALLRSLKDHQVLITTTHLPDGLKDVCVHEVTSGCVRSLTPA